MSYRLNFRIAVSPLSSHCPLCSVVAVPLLSRLHPMPLCTSISPLLSLCLIALHTYVSKLSRYVQVSRPLRLHCSRCRLRRTRLLSFSHATRALPLPIDRRFRRCCASALTVYIYLRTRSLCACNS